MRKAVIWTVALMASVIAAAASAARSNQISITVPTHALVGTKKTPETYGVSVKGFARRTANAYLFIDYAGCAKSFSAEYKRAGRDGRVHWPVNRSFQHTSYWGSDYAGVDHACGYLLAKGSGTVLASSQVRFRIHSR
jgi:hypothetical protein